jgi:hypothetical protein
MDYFSHQLSNAASMFHLAEVRNCMCAFIKQVEKMSSKNKKEPLFQPIMKQKKHLKCMISFISNLYLYFIGTIMMY